MHEAVETGLHGKDQDREEVGMQPPPCARSLRHGSGVCGPSASSDYTHDSISSMPDVKHTGQITLCSDSKGNAFLNQYVVIGDLGQGSFSKVGGVGHKDSDRSLPRCARMYLSSSG